MKKKYQFANSLESYNYLSIPKCGLEYEGLSQMNFVSRCKRAGCCSLYRSFSVSITLYIGTMSASLTKNLDLAALKALPVVVDFVAIFGCEAPRIGGTSSLAQTLQAQVRCSVERTLVQGSVANRFRTRWTLVAFEGGSIMGYL